MLERLLLMIIYYKLSPLSRVLILWLKQHGLLVFDLNKQLDITHRMMHW